MLALVVGMTYGTGREPSPPPNDDALAFHEIVAAYVKALKAQPTKFVKKLDEMPKVSLSPSSSKRKALALADRGLIVQFMGIWPSPNIMAFCLEKN